MKQARRGVAGTNKTHKPLMSEVSEGLWSGSKHAVLETVAGEVAWDISGCQDQPKPVHEQGVQERLPILEQKQGTWDVTPTSEIGHH